MGDVSHVIRALVTLSLVCALLCPVPSALAADRPHIILIVADDLGHNDVSFHGSDQIPTPNIDFLAYNGVLLNNYYVSPICTPTRSALLTGRHPIHTDLCFDVFMFLSNFSQQLLLNVAFEALLPLFLYLPFQAVHRANADGPHLQAPDKYVKRFEYIENHDRRMYAGEGTTLLLPGVKATLWEGGVRGVGLLHSPLLHTQGYVSEQMLHVCDWLPTLYAAAGGDPSTLHNLDGFNAWDMLSRNSSGVRTEMLHNIDPIEDFAGVRVGGYKLLIGDVGVDWGGWYPPYQLAGDEITLNYLNFTDDLTERVTQDSRRRELEQKYREYWGPEIWARLEDLHSSGGKTGADLVFNPEKSLGQVSSTNRDWVRGTPVRIECGVKPANASTNCDPRKSPCLFHIPTDPCEYNNIAESRPEVVTALFARIKEYVATMVSPGKKPNDARSNPKYHGGAWVPWE
ncbi:arylsulfatase I [Aplysia californica]|uniref:Arylsulfatase I n=1 Tax=Aplysia californica TaxID=6500 RepID=A0ABM1W3L5_APLCA|nr:arylsulfatase I [Aplysia californica]